MDGRSREGLQRKQKIYDCAALAGFLEVIRLVESQF